MINKVSGQAYSMPNARIPANSERGGSTSIDTRNGYSPLSVAKESTWNILDRIQDDAAAITASTKEQSVAQRIEFIQKELDALATKDSKLTFERVDANGTTYFKATSENVTRIVSAKSSYSDVSNGPSIKLQMEKFDDQMQKFLADHAELRMSVSTEKNGMKVYRFYSDDQLHEKYVFDEEFFIQNDLVGKNEVEIKLAILQLLGNPESMTPSEYFNFVDTFNKVGLPLDGVPYFKEIDVGDGSKLYNMSDMGALRRMTGVNFFGKNVMESIKSYTYKTNWIDMLKTIAAESDKAYAMGWDTYNGDRLRAVATTLSDLVKLMTKSVA